MPRRTIVVSKTLEEKIQELADKEGKSWSYTAAEILAAAVGVEIENNWGGARRGQKESESDVESMS
jgi:hypothetical protein